MRHLMSTLIRIQFGLCYLDFKIVDFCRGSGDSSQLQHVIRLGNFWDCLIPQNKMTNSEMHSVNRISSMYT